MELADQLRALISDAPGNYINAAKVKAILDRHEEECDRHADHPRLWINGQTLCSCGEWMPGMSTIALPVETPFITAYSAASSAYAHVLESDDRQDINACIEAALIAALKAYGIEVGDWFAEAYGKPNREG